MLSVHACVLPSAHSCYTFRHVYLKCLHFWSSVDCYLVLSLFPLIIVDKSPRHCSFQHPVLFYST